MPTRMRILLLGLIALLAGCHSIRSYRAEREIESWRREALKKIDVEQCLSVGGEIGGVGMFGLPACIRQFSDAGKACRDGSECEGRCPVDLSVDSTPQSGEEAVGKCEVDDDWSGCSADVKNGIAQATWCQD